jgi:predicted unusual protein kinase regulating ubiquinone biosynthesis (AarF/ABC1/UbiB family)
MTTTLTLTTARSLIDQIGTYAEKWFAFMERNHPRLVKKMLASGTLLEVAQSVDDTAWEYRELLDAQYMKLHPRPKTFEEIVKWETTRCYYTDGQVMREKVLIPVTTP